MELETLSNKRIAKNDFSMDHPCSFCESFVTAVVQIPKTDLLACKGCLTNMILAIDKEIGRGIKK